MTFPFRRMAGDVAMKEGSMAGWVERSNLVKFAGEMGILLHMEAWQGRMKKLNIVYYTLTSVGPTQKLLNLDSSIINY